MVGKSDMNIAIIGLGSMGKRRLRLIKELYPEYCIVGVDGRDDRREEAVKEYAIRCYKSVGDIDISIDCAFVCTSPLSHNNIISMCLDKGWHVFTELNLVSDGYEENMKKAASNKLTLFLSSTFLYREEIKYVMNKVKYSGKWNYIYHIGQYLPDWHPWENYKDFFLGDKRTNGCREILAIELPWILETFGEVENFHVCSDKITELNIDYQDNYMIQIVHKNGSKGSLVVDVVSPVAVRKLEMYGEGRYISWSGTPDSLMEYSQKSGGLEKVTLMEKAEHVDGYREFVTENAYKNEIKEFFDAVLYNKEPPYDFKKDMAIIDLIDKIGA